MIIIEHLDPKKNFKSVKLGIDPIKTGLNRMSGGEQEFYARIEETILKGKGQSVSLLIGFPNGEELRLPHAIGVILSVEKEQRTTEGIILPPKYGK